MIRLNHTSAKKLGFVILALMLAAILPLGAMAETATTDATTTPETDASATMPMQQPFFGGNGQPQDQGVLDLSTLTEDQKKAYESALSTYEQIEDAVLADLVTAGVVTQADVDSYQTLREANKSLADLDQSTWTALQLKAYYEASMKTGDERKAAYQALADAGQLTQAQATALSGEGTQNQLWLTIRTNERTNAAIQLAVGTMQQARNAYRETLRTAGINAGMDALGFDDMGGRGGQDGMPGPGDNSQTQDGGMMNRPQQSGTQQGGSQQDGSQQKGNK